MPATVLPRQTARLTDAEYKALHWLSYLEDLSLGLEFLAAFDLGEQLCPR
jgi:hypothetical protein